MKKPGVLIAGVIALTVLVLIVLNWIPLNARADDYQIQDDGNLTQGLVGYWKFDEGSGNITADISGKGNNGSLVNGPTWVEGKVGNALRFDGIDDYVYFSNKVQYSVSNSPFSYTIWVYNEKKNTGWNPILSSNESDGQTHLLIHHDNEENIYIEDCHEYYTFYKALAMEWVHIAVVSDGYRVKVYLNGQIPLINTNSCDYGNLSFSYLGRTHDDYSIFYGGKIDEFRVYNRTLTTNEIKDIYYGFSVHEPNNLNLSQEDFSTEPMRISDGSDDYGIPDMAYKGNSSYIKAENIQGINPQYLIDDVTYYNGYYYGVPTAIKTEDEKAINLSYNGERIRLNITNIRKGIYAIRIMGRVNSSVTRLVKPLYLHLYISDGLNGSYHDYRMRALYSNNTIKDVGRFFFNSLYDFTNLTGEIYIGNGSQEELLIHRIEFYDALQGINISRIKQSSGTYTAAERVVAINETLEVASHGEYEIENETGDMYGDMVIWRWIHYKNDSDPYNPHYIPVNLTASERIARDDAIWNGLPPLNTMYLSGSGGNAGAYYPDDKTLAEIEEEYGEWVLEPDYYTYYTYHYYLSNWTLRNTKYNITYTLDDLINHRPLPDPYPYKDDGLGYYFPSNVQNSPGAWLFIVGPKVFYRIYPQYIGVMYNHEGGIDSAERFYLTNDTDVARDAALALVRLALQWPGMQMEVQDLSLNSATTDLTYNSFNRWNRYGKFHYSGWSGDQADYMAQAYDWLYPYIENNQELADAVHRYVPWVETPDDAIALLDSYLLQGTINDEEVERTRGSSQVMHGLILGPSNVSDYLMDASTALSDVYPIGTDSLKLHYSNSYTRDGTHYIGSAFYTLGITEDILTDAYSMKKYKILGGQLKYDWSDIEKYRKVKAAASVLFDFWMAGGYVYAVGDVGGPYTSRFRFTPTETDYLYSWELAREPKSAWMLANIYGRSIQNDSEWSEIEDAASAIRDPRLSMESRVNAGFGAAVLEGGVKEEDYRNKSALFMRLGTGVGHSHYDALDIGIYSLGLQMGTDFGQRNEGVLYTLPPDFTSYTHNTVEVDGYSHPWKAQNGWPSGSFTGSEAYLNGFAPESPAGFMSGKASSTGHTNVTLFQRDSSLIEIKNEVNATMYVFDIFRVEGGKLHTYSFHGTDSGIEEGSFYTTVPLIKIDDTSGSSISATYLRKHADGRKYAGTAPRVFSAVWRTSRNSSSTSECNNDGTCLNVTTIAAEPNMLGEDYNASSPRKYTKATIFAHEGDVIMTANLFSQSYSMNYPILYLQHGQDITDYGNMSSISDVYPVIIETYQGKPVIANKQELEIESNENDSRKAVALQITQISGKRDILFSDGREMLRNVSNGTLLINARFGYFSQDDKGFNGFHIVQGIYLKKGLTEVAVNFSYYNATISSVNYSAGTLIVNSIFPNGALAGREFIIENDDHHTSYYVTMVENLSNGSLLYFDKDPLMGEGYIVSVIGTQVTTENEYVLGDNSNRNAGYTAANEAHTKFWKLDRISTGVFNLSGDSVSYDDFTDEDDDGETSLLIYDFGPGDTIKTPVSIGLERDDNSSYALQANAPFEITLAGEGRMYLVINSTATSDITTNTSNFSITGYVNVTHYRQTNYHIVMRGCNDSDSDGISEYNSSACVQGRDLCLESGISNWEPYRPVFNHPLILMNYTNLTAGFLNASNITFQRSGVGRIFFKRPLRLVDINSTGCIKQINLSSLISMSAKRFSISSQNHAPFNSEAELYFEQVDVLHPAIYKDGELCEEPDCTIKSFNSTTNVLIAEVSGFSEYTVEEGTYCGDNTCQSNEDCNSCSSDCGACFSEEHEENNEEDSGGKRGGGGGGAAPAGNASKATVNITKNNSEDDKQIASNSGESDGTENIWWDKAGNGKDGDGKTLFIGIIVVLAGGIIFLGFRIFIAARKRAGMLRVAAESTQEMHGGKPI